MGGRFVWAAAKTYVKRTRTSSVVIKVECDFLEYLDCHKTVLHVCPY